MTQLYQQLMRIFGEPRGYDIFMLIADISIVYYVIYRLILLIQGTRALQMLIGLLLIVLGYFFSDFFGLVTLHWIISNFIFQVFLIIIVVFQSDIRRALIRLGNNPFLAGGGNREAQLILEELVRAAVALSDQRVGALIVIERTADIIDFIGRDSVGTEIDAKVTKELLQAIFIPEKENPVHDGAVIIRNGRIHSAGCFLPLSQSTKLERTLGTRHRAALGITEHIDAVVVVVSEERAKISLCVDGNLMKDLPVDQLRAQLFSLFAARPKPPQDPTPEAAPATNAQPKAQEQPSGGE
jgi:diadenylate cyclase